MKLSTAFLKDPKTLKGSITVSNDPTGLAFSYSEKKIEIKKNRERKKKKRKNLNPLYAPFFINNFNFRKGNFN